MADELMVNYNDINYMYDMIQKFPNKKYIVRIRKDDKVNWEELRMFNDEYTCTQVSVSIIGDIQNLSKISFMGNILSKNEYGKYSGYVNNLSLRNNETYTLEKA